MTLACRAALCTATALLANFTAAPAMAGTARLAPLPHPVVGSLQLPSTVAYGKLPRVSVRVDEKGVHMVFVQVTLTDLDTHSTALTASAGWVPTRRRFTVRWPAGATLPAGSFQVTVSAHDHRGQALLRGPHTSGEATLTVESDPMPPAAPAPDVPATGGVSTASEPGVPSVAQTVAEGAVFPVDGAHNFGGPENIFGAPRDGYLHQGQDILTAEGTPIVAPFAGTVLATSYQEGGGGYYVVEHANIGFDIMNAHCEAGTVAVRDEQALTPGQVLCHAGETGDATTPHVDFEMWVGGWQSPGSHPVNPLPYLEAWEHYGPVG